MLLPRRSFEALKCPSLGAGTSVTGHKRQKQDFFFLKGGGGGEGVSGLGFAYGLRGSLKVFIVWLARGFGLRL